MYNEYILKEMVKERVEDAHRQAAADSICRQLRQSSSAHAPKCGGKIRELVEGLYRAVSRQSAEAHG